jgi:acyl-CoA synthetase (AMP-forming)/AMP-acid ligase II
MNLGHLFDQAARRWSDRIALSDGSRRVSYSALDSRTLRLGQALMDLGLRKGDRIATLQYNAIEAIEIDVMAARFGFVRTFLNARSDLASHVHVLNDCGARLLFVGADFQEQIGEARSLIPSVGSFVSVGHSSSWSTEYEAMIARAPCKRFDHDVSPQDWHSIYYTSGSTGKPKGVVLDQRNWLVLVRNHLTDLFRTASETDVVLHAAPLSHGSGAFVWAHLVRGARQHVMRRFHAVEAIETIHREGVTTSFLAPTMVVKLLDADPGDSARQSRLHSVVYGGAPMPAERVAEALRRWGPVFAQLYGQWEAPQYFTWLSQRAHEEALRDDDVQRLGSAGVPATFARVAVMDEDGRLLPPGESGEIVTAGDHLMVGYLNRPEETSSIRAGIWQRTGDIGRIDEQGFCHLVDRKNDVIVTGGSNVYPREIEEILYTHPDVKEALAFGVPDAVWGEKVHALVVPRTAPPGPEAFLAWCAVRLAADKRPRSVEFVADLPKSDYGKVLRREVRARYWQGRSRLI